MGSLAALHLDLFGKFESGHWRSRSNMVLCPRPVSSCALLRRAAVVPA
jgi:hypothetical protein